MDLNSGAAYAQNTKSATVEHVNPQSISEHQMLKENSSMLNDEEGELPIVNNGHTIEVEFVGDVGENFIVLDGVDVYNLLQFHVHTPSENTLNGNHYDLEVHFVHINTFLELAVVGVFVDAPDDDAECAFLEQLMGDLPEDSGEENEVDIETFINFNDDTEYFTFSGSLTTPPCTEDVQWIVRQTPIRCGKSQVDAIFDIISTTNRPVQPKNGRTVFSGSKNAATSSRSTASTDSTSSNSGTSSSSASSLQVALLAILGFVLLSI